MGFLLGLEDEVTFFVNLVVVVPLDTPHLGELVILEEEAGERHHAVQGEMLVIIKDERGIGGVKAVAAKSQGHLVFAGVELVQVNEINYLVLVVADDKKYFKVIRFLAQRDSIGRKAHAVIHRPLSDELRACRHITFRLVVESETLFAGEGRETIQLGGVAAQYAMAHLHDVGKGIHRFVVVHATATSYH